MIEIKVPELAESITEGTIARWLKEEGDSVSEGEVLLELETDKVNLEIQAENPGILEKIVKPAGENVQVGEVIAHLKEQTAGNTKEEETAERRREEQPEEKPKSSPSVPIASPAARRRAREHGIDLNRVQGRDPLGRIRMDDVGKRPTDPSPAKEESVTKSVAPREGKDRPPEDPMRPVERKRMSRRRLTIANRLVQAQHNAAMLTTFNEVDMSAVIDIRRRRKEAFRQRHEVGLGFMSFFTKAVVGALKEFPLLNAEIRGEEILIKKYYDIGIAVATDEGLVVPVVRNADRLSFAGIEREIASLAEKARSNTLTLDDLSGGTFTITNGGVFGSLLSTPILNAPQVGILGMHTIQKRPVTLKDGSIESLPMMYIALSYDHRLIDGREAVQFLVRVKEMLEDPELLLLEG
ncbi:2-oxoglutarate dehydrogenase complex dihydrolipoyllysine-residue succinyltransferase [Lihuaxuella thermophila]|uniref:Dihydrolipoyllysine-residue succinyltransferase component of 2-oxoglutarate dehydrogenase complex n=1 Tax=Lihuaxuella thermophila TaxID=1173111 RepID=A0A1H8FFI2_9BACL|nr:2-oxoglutarate dehydrogenase complex dihydrolipoyllysine-residue succinyltransferase [Lihuaxuella thermophila]SEN30376.1 2-oxoglutarate dehydrogenase E2 component (dihydrolipoamide succinyltransferase) [Lihuaxuella thermophila]